MQIIIFYITNSDEDAAERLGNLTISKKLAGCANIFPVHSIFPWDDAIQRNAEYVLLLKTTLSKKNELKSFLAEHHPYEVPCIMSWIVDVNDEYGSWIERNVN